MDKKEIMFSILLGKKTCENFDMVALMFCILMITRGRKYILEPWVGCLTLTEDL